MPLPGSDEWPFRSEDTELRQRDNSSPYRQDIAVATYLEKQRSHRKSTGRHFDLSAAAISLRSLAGPIGHALSDGRRVRSREV